MPPTPRPPVKKLVTIDDGVLAMLAADPKAVREFPFLSALAQKAPAKKPGCGGCGGGAAAARAKAFADARRHVVGLPPGKRVQLRNLLKAGQLQVRITTGTKVKIVRF